MHSSPHHVRAFSGSIGDLRPARLRPRAPRPALPALPALPTPPAHQPRTSLAPASPRPRPDISHVIRFLDDSTTSTNVAMPTTGFQCLKDARGNYVRDCWETTKQRPPPTQQGRDRRTRPRPRRNNRTNQMRKGSFLTSPRPFHQAPRPSVSPALVSGIRMRTSA